MKNLLKTIAILFLASTLSMANKSLPTGNEEELSFKMGMYFDQSAGKIKTFYEKEEGTRLEVSILDKQGNVLAETVIGKKHTSARFNFDINELPDGAYYIEVKNGKEVLKRELHVETSKPMKQLIF